MAPVYEKWNVQFFNNNKNKNLLFIQWEKNAKRRKLHRVFKMKDGLKDERLLKIMIAYFLIAFTKSRLSEEFQPGFS